MASFKSLALLVVVYIPGNPKDSLAMTPYLFAASKSVPPGFDAISIPSWCNAADVASAIQTYSHTRSRVAD